MRVPSNTRLKLAAPVLYDDGVNTNLRCCRIAFVKLRVWRRSLSAVR
jgi:hypothetical protein